MVHLEKKIPQEHFAQRLPLQTPQNHRKIPVQHINMQTY